MRRQQYFAPQEGPPPLERGVFRAVRFEETDPMGVVWHGRYPGYFEDARVMLGNSIGLGYMALSRAGLATPVTSMSIDYKSPLRYGDTTLITARLHYTPAARLHIDYMLGSNGKILCTGCTVQHFTTTQGELCLARPALYDELCTRWQQGLIARTLPPFACLSHEGAGA